jgi:hypothetical protein
MEVYKIRVRVYLTLRNIVFITFKRLMEQQLVETLYYIGFSCCVALALELSRNYLPNAFRRLYLTVYFILSFYKRH